MWSGNINNATMGGSSPWVTVGSYDWCDYKTDGTDDQTEINLALSNNENVVIASDVNISGPINITGSSQWLSSFGGPRGNTNSRIYINTDGITAINITGGSNRVSGVSLVGSGIATSGVAICINGSCNVISDISINKYHDGIYIGTAGGISELSDVWITSSNGTMLSILGSETTVRHFRADGYQDENNTQCEYGVYIDGVGNALITESEFIRCGTNFYIRDSGCVKVANTYFDQGIAPNYIVATSGNIMRHATFSNCWISGLTVTTPNNVPLVQISSSSGGTLYDVNFVDTTMRDSPGTVFLLYNDGGDVSGLSFSNIRFSDLSTLDNCALFSTSGIINAVSITGCSIEQHSAAAGWITPIWFGANQTDWIIDSCDFSDATIPIQGYTNNITMGDNILPS